jgi:hypothetical protein
VERWVTSDLLHDSWSMRTGHTLWPVDCIFTTGPLAASLAECEAKALPASPIVLAISSRHRLRNRKKVRLSEIAGERHLYAAGRQEHQFRSKAVGGPWYGQELRSPPARYSLITNQ